MHLTERGHSCPPPPPNMNKAWSCFPAWRTTLLRTGMSALRARLMQKVAA